MNFASHGNFSAHKDVLEATPDSDASKAALLEECKRRGRAAVGAGQWPDAAALYTKALECCSESSAQAILNANKSLCQGKMRMWDEALASAALATEQDEAYLKGWWRLGQACAAKNEYDRAVSSMETGLVLEPSNKALKKELDKLKEQKTKYEKEQAEKAAKEGPEEEEGATTSATKTTTVIKEKAGKEKATAAEQMEKMDIDGDEFTASDHVKGYKIVGGKKTSFFHNELDEKTAQLIGDITPQRLDADMSDANQNAAGTVQQNGTSAWNKAGTWEEKDCSKWAMDSLKAKMLEASYTLPASSPAPDALLTVETVKISGSASVAAVRGKKRYIYEFDVTANWKFLHGTVSAAGTIRFPDVDGTCALGEPYDVSDFTVTKTDDATVRPLLSMFCHQQGLRLALHKSIDDWVRMFKETY